MAIYVNNPFGTDAAEINETTAGDRSGHRIRRIREEQNPPMTQKQLGEKIGLNANRVQQYENGARKPKLELAEKFAEALGVETSALLDPVLDNYIGIMYGCFELEDRFGLTVKKINGQYCLCFEEDNEHSYRKIRQVNDMLSEWHARKQEMIEELDKAETEEARRDIIHRYHMWEWTFPKALADRSSKEMEKAKEKQRIRDEMENLQNRLDELNKDE